MGDRPSRPAPPPAVAVAAMVAVGLLGPAGGSVAGALRPDLALGRGGAAGAVAVPARAVGLLGLRQGDAAGGPARGVSLATCRPTSTGTPLALTAPSPPPPAIALPAVLAALALVAAGALLHAVPRQSCGGVAWRASAAAGEGDAARERGVYFHLDDLRYQVLAKAELPAIIPREDLMTQLKNWARWQYETNGYELYGIQMTVSGTEDAAGKCLSFTIALPTVNPQIPVVELSVGYDDTVVLLRKQTPETGWGLQRTFNMHIDESLDVHAVTGRYFIVRVRRSPTPLPYDAKPAIGDVLRGLSHAIDRYYTFGSPFKFDAT